MSSDLLGIGLRGLMSAKKQIDVTGHNISNVNTEGYSRQKAIQVNTPTSDGQFGYGSDIVDIRRSANNFALSELRYSSSNNSYWSSQVESFAATESLTTNITEQLNSSISEVYKSITQLGTNRDNVSFQQAFTTQQKMFVQNAQSANNQYTNIENSLSQQIDFTVGQINQNFSSLADLNVKIQWASVQGNTPNDLLDQRDMVVSKLQDLIGGQALEQKNGTSFFSKNGQMFVFDDKALSIVRDGDSFKLQTSYGNVNLPKEEFGGQLGGLNTALAQTKDIHQDVNQWVASTATLLNQSNMQGLTQTNLQGSTLFNIDTIQVTGANAPAVKAAGTMKDMSIAYDGTQFAITTKDGTSVSNTAPSIINGYELSWPTPITAGAWSFKAPSNISELTIAHSDVALGNPYASSNANIGAKIQSMPFENNNFNVSWNAGVVNMTKSDGTVLTGTITDKKAVLNGIEFNFSSDTGSSAFTINTGRLNNGNVKNFALNDGIKEESKNILSKTGFIASNMSSMSEHFDTYNQTVQTLVDEKQGVNLDEEAANLIAYQQAYSAASQVIKMSKDLFNEVLGAIR